MAVGVSLWGGWLTQLLAGDAFAAASYIFPLLVGQIVLIPMSHFLHFAMMLDGRTRMIGRIIILSTITNLLLNLLLIPTAGLAGAAAAGTLSYVIMVVSSLWAGRLLPYIQYAALRLGSLVLSTGLTAASVIALRRTTESAVIIELLLAGIVFLLAGFMTNLWTRDEMRYILRRKKKMEPLQR
jgi:O-antigen/teichoic acid export membrane protein